MIVAPPLPAEHPNLASYVNSFLPDQIRMWGWVRTINSFQARTYVPLIHRADIRTCDSRVYEYLLPTYCLLPPASDDALAKHLDNSSPGWREGLGEAAAFADAWVPEEEEPKPEGEGAEGTAPKLDTTEAKEGEEVKEGEPVKVAPKKAGEFERRRGWRCDQATLERFRNLIKEFVGTQYVYPTFVLHF
jgi:tRNA pseudouridine38-40 synthase